MDAVGKMGACKLRSKSFNGLDQGFFLVYSDMAHVGIEIVFGKLPADFFRPAARDTGAKQSAGLQHPLYLAQRTDGERFLDTYRRIGMAPFKEAIYG